jgi:hypothetical protein
MIGLVRPWPPWPTTVRVYFEISSKWGIVLKCYAWFLIVFKFLCANGTPNVWAHILLAVWRWQCSDVGETTNWVLAHMKHCPKFSSPSRRTRVATTSAGSTCAPQDAGRTTSLVVRWCSSIAIGAWQMWCLDLCLSRIDRILISQKTIFFWNWSSKNFLVKHTWPATIWRWETDRKVLLGSTRSRTKVSKNT